MEAFVQFWGKVGADFAEGKDAGRVLRSCTGFGEKLRTVSCGHAGTLAEEAAEMITHDLVEIRDLLPTFRVKIFEEIRVHVFGVQRMPHALNYVLFKNHHKNPTALLQALREAAIVRACVPEHGAILDTSTTPRHLRR